MDFSQTDIVRISKVLRIVLKILSILGSSSAGILLAQHDIQSTRSKMGS